MLLSSLDASVGVWGLLSALGAAFGWAAFDALRKQTTTTLGPIGAATGLAIIGGSALGIGWAIQGGHVDWRAYAMAGVANIALQTGANFLFLKSVERSPLSVTIPYLSLTPCLVALVAWFSLGEMLDGRQLIGVALCVVGALFVHGRLNPLAGLKEHPGALYMCGVALLWSISLPLDKRCLDAADVMAHATIQTAGVAIPMGLIWATKSKSERSGDIASMRNFPFLLTGLFGALPVFLQLASLEADTPVGIVEAIKRGIGPVVAAVVGVIFFKERVGKMQILALTVLIIGVMLVLL